MLETKAVLDVRNDRMNELGEARSVDFDGAIAELSGIVSDNAIGLSDMADAVAELSEVISEIVTGGEQ